MQILFRISQSNDKKGNPKYPDLDFLIEIHPEDGFLGGEIRFRISRSIGKSGFRFSTFYCKGHCTAKIIESEETVRKDEFRTSWNNEKLASWKEKRPHCQFSREIPETTHVRETWSWLRKADLKNKTKVLICTGQEQVLRINYVTDTILTRRRNPPYVGYVARKVRV